ncbi:MAG: CIA30 family protein [Polaribacter sp.]
MILSKTIFDFNKKANIQNWIVVNDVVMGGKSTSSFKLNADGNGAFVLAFTIKSAKYASLFLVLSFTFLPAPIIAAFS